MGITLRNSNLDKLGEQVYDVLIVGGGINGAVAAASLAGRGVKVALIERLWQIVYVDGKMDQHEHYLMNKMSNLLRLSHKQLIDAKLKVLHNK